VVVRDLVIVPGDDPRTREVGGLEIRVALVEPVAIAIAGEVLDARAVLGTAGARAAVLVDVVAEPRDEVDVFGGESRVRRVEALHVALARRAPEAQQRRARGVR